MVPLKINLKALLAFVGMTAVVGLATSPVVGVAFAIASGIVIELLMTLGTLGLGGKD